MNENASQQPPPLATNGKRPKIGSPAHEILTRGIVEHRNASQCHGDKHRNIDAENGLRNRHRTGLRPHPWRGFDALDRRILAALRSFMLHAPLAKLPAEGEGWKLTTTLSAICHQRLEDRRAPRGFRGRLRSLSTQIITCFIPVVAAPGKDIIELACDGIAIAERRPAAAANPLFHIK
jgi:hypothetical protein